MIYLIPTCEEEGKETLNYIRGHIRGIGVSSDVKACSVLMITSNNDVI